MNFKYRTIHNSWDPNLVFPFAVSKHSQDKIFIDPTWGIRIERILADRTPVRAEEFRGRLDDLNFNKMPIGGDPFIYQVRRSHLVFARSFTDADQQLEKYTVPNEARLLVFEYRLREANDIVGPVMTLESVRP